MEKEDVEDLPTFTRERASRGKLRKAFGGRLESLIQELNATVAA
jgi:hypothetical protein